MLSIAWGSLTKSYHSVIPKFLLAKKPILNWPEDSTQTFKKLVGFYKGGFAADEEVEEDDEWANLLQKQTTTTRQSQAIGLCEWGEPATNRITSQTEGFAPLTRKTTFEPFNYSF